MSTWKAALLLSSPFILGGMFIFVYYPTFAWFWERWMREESYFSHGPLIPLISIFLIWRERRKLRNIPIQTDNAGLVVLLGGLLLQLFSAWTRIHFVSGFSFLVALMGLCWYLLGGRITRVIWFSLFFLAFMTPWPLDLVNKLTLQLKLVAASLGASIANLLGTTNVREGSVVYLSKTTVTIDAPCSGLKSIITFLAMGTLYAYIVPNAPLRRWILVLLCTPIAIFANLVRVVLILIISNRFGESIITDDFLHKGFGVLVFVIGLIGFFIVAKLLRLELPIAASGANPRENSRPPRRGGPQGVTGENSGEDEGGNPTPALFSGKAVALAVALLGAVGVATFGAFDEVMEENKLLYTYGFPHTVGDWRLDRQIHMSDRIIRVLETEDTIYWTYRRENGDKVDLVLVYSPHNRKVSHPPDICFQGGGWEQQMKDILPAPYGESFGFTKVNRLVLERGRERQIALYWYKTGKEQTPSYLKQQIGYLINSALRRESRSVALIRLTAFAEEATQIEEKTAQLQAFAEQITPTIDRVLP
jgi:EpsI family protein